MNKVKVRCWEVRVESCDMGNPLFITYPEDNSGHDLITCISCGAVYAVTVAKEVYIGPPLAEKIQGLNCLSCGSPLNGNFAYYPETYVINGKSYSFERPKQMPPDEESIVVEFDGIYE